MSSVVGYLDISLEQHPDLARIDRPPRRFTQRPAPEVVPLYPKVPSRGRRR